MTKKSQRLDELWNELLDLDLRRTKREVLTELIGALYSSGQKELADLMTNRLENEPW